MQPKDFFDSVGGSSRLSDRGSRNRLRNLKFRDHWSLGMTVFVVLVIRILYIAFPWMLRHVQR